MCGQILSLQPLSGCRHLENVNLLENKISPATGLLDAKGDGEI
jgi:hypothetical protein